jgi:SAM-dependent methyltransferase
MDRVTADLAAYYEDEAEARLERSIDPERIAHRVRFVDRCLAEGIGSILDVGMGPGRDALAIRSTGLRAVGLDLAHESARLALRDGVPALQGSLHHLPVRSGSFDAVWTMSTLVHVPDERFDEAVAELARAVRSGGLIAVGLWGGRDREGVIDFESGRAGRFFSLRTHERARRMLGVHGDVVEFDTWDGAGSHGWEYQFAVLRT